MTQSTCRADIGRNAAGYAKGLNNSNPDVLESRTQITGSLLQHELPDQQVTAVTGDNAAAAAALQAVAGPVSQGVGSDLKRSATSDSDDSSSSYGSAVAAVECLSHRPSETGVLELLSNSSTTAATSQTHTDSVFHAVVEHNGSEQQEQAHITSSKVDSESPSGQLAEHADKPNRAAATAGIVQKRLQPDVSVRQYMAGLQPPDPVDAACNYAASSSSGTAYEDDWEPEDEEEQQQQDTADQHDDSVESNVYDEDIQSAVHLLHADRQAAADRQQAQQWQPELVDASSYVPGDSSNGGVVPSAGSVHLPQPYIGSVGLVNTLGQMVDDMCTAAAADMHSTASSAVMEWSVEHKPCNQDGRCDFMDIDQDDVHRPIVAYDQPAAQQQLLVQAVARANSSDGAADSPDAGLTALSLTVQTVGADGLDTHADACGSTHSSSSAGADDAMSLASDDSSDRGVKEFTDTTAAVNMWQQHLQQQLLARDEGPHTTCPAQLQQPNGAVGGGGAGGGLVADCNSPESPDSPSFDDELSEVHNYERLASGSDEEDVNDKGCDIEAGLAGYSTMDCYSSAGPLGLGAMGSYSGAEPAAALLRSVDRATAAGAARSREATAQTEPVTSRWSATASLGQCSQHTSTGHTPLSPPNRRSYFDQCNMAGCGPLGRSLGPGHHVISATAPASGVATASGSLGRLAEYERLPGEQHSNPVGSSFTQYSSTTSSTGSQSDQDTDLPLKERLLRSRERSATLAWQGSADADGSATGHSAGGSAAATALHPSFLESAAVVKPPGGKASQGINGTNNKKKKGKKTGAAVGGGAAVVGGGKPERPGVLDRFDRAQGAQRERELTRRALYADAHDVGDGAPAEARFGSAEVC